MLASNRNVLYEHLVGCAKDVLNAYDLAVDSVEVDAQALPDPKLAAVICFGGDGVHGELVLVAVVRASYPVPAEQRATVTDASVQDWAGELVNQLLGRLKRKLLMSGLDIETGLPRATSVERLAHRTGATDGSYSLHLCAHAGRNALVAVWLDTVVPDHIDLARPSGVAQAILAEGEVLLF